LAQKRPHVHYDHAPANANERYFGTLRGTVRGGFPDVSDKLAPFTVSLARATPVAKRAELRLRSIHSNARIGNWNFCFRHGQRCNPPFNYMLRKAGVSR